MRWRRVVIWLCIGLLAAGCWNRREIETLGFALAAGFDWNLDGEQYEVTVQLVKPQAMAQEAPGGGLGPGERAYWTYSAQGATIFDAVRSITQVSPRKVWWGHLQVLVIGEEAARRGVGEVLDFITRNGEPRRLFWVVVTPGSARELLEVKSESEPVGALAMLDLIRIRGATSKSAPVRMKRLIIMLSKPAVAATTGVLRLAPPGSGPSADFQLSGAAVFRKDRLAGYLDETETRGMLWVRGEAIGGIVVIPCPEDRTGSIGIEVLHATAQVQPGFQGQAPAATLFIRVEAHLGDMTCSPPVTPNLERASEALTQAIRAEIEAALSKARELQLDIFGLGLHFDQEYPRAWRMLEDSWGERFSQLPVDLRIQATVERKGMQERPLIR